MAVDSHDEGRVRRRRMEAVMRMLRRRLRLWRRVGGSLVTAAQVRSVEREQPPEAAWYAGEGYGALEFAPYKKGVLGKHFRRCWGEEERERRRGGRRRGGRR